MGYDSEEWFHSVHKKPETNLIVHAVTKVGKELDVVEAWWTGDKWVIPSARSQYITPNVIIWRLKPEIPYHLIESYFL